MMDKPKGFSTRKQYALDSMRSALLRASRPILLTSFGKESLCLLSLIEESGVQIDAAYFELGVVAGAHRFARKYIATGRIPITLLSPHETTIVAGAGGADLSYLFRLANGDTFQIVGATFDDRLTPGLGCGLQPGLSKSGRHEAYDWDVILTGRRNVDVDETLGALTVGADSVVLDHGTVIAMPLLYWTDKDVAYYLTTSRTHALDWERYEVVAGTLKSRPDPSVNPDRAPICIRCLAAKVLGPPDCPLRLTMANASFSLPKYSYFDAGNVPPSVML